jgi:diaminopimelate epimerase
MIKFVKAHAYGNDFLYVRSEAASEDTRVELARAMCDRHAGIGADGLIFYSHAGAEAVMSLINADGSLAEVSGNGVRGLAALILQHDSSDRASIVIRTDAGEKTLVRTHRSGVRQTFRGSMGQPADVRETSIDLAGERLSVVTLNMGNPQCVLLGPLPDEGTFRRVGSALERHAAFPAGTNVEFAHVESSTLVRILIWERGVGPTTSSGTGSCAALVAAAQFGGAAREAAVVAPGGSQRVEWTADGVFLTGWAEVICEGEWLGQIPRTAASHFR